MRTPRYSEAVSGLALIAALGGTAHAAAALDSSDVKNGTVAAADIGNGSLLGKDIRDGTLDPEHLGFDPPRGRRGIPGAPGSTGEQGDPGAPGSAGKDGLGGVAGKDGRDGIDAFTTGTVGGALEGAFPAPALRIDAVTADALGPDAVIAHKQQPGSLSHTDLAFDARTHADTPRTAKTTRTVIPIGKTFQDISLYESKDRCVSSYYRATVHWNVEGKPATTPVLLVRPVIDGEPQPIVMKDTLTGSTGTTPVAFAIKESSMDSLQAAIQGDGAVNIDAVSSQLRSCVTEH